MYKIGDYISTIYRRGEGGDGYAIGGTVTGKHGSADYYSVRIDGGPVVYRWGEELKPNIRDADFVEAMNRKFV